MMNYNPIPVEGSKCDEKCPKYPTVDKKLKQIVISNKISQPKYPKSSEVDEVTVTAGGKSL